MLPQSIPPSFDVISIKEGRTVNLGQDLVSSGMRAFMRNHRAECLPGGSFVQRGLAVQQAIQWAYHIAGQQVTGAPDWVGQRFFDIDGRSDRRVMVRSVGRWFAAFLTVGSSLLFIWEQREMPVLALTVAKGGLRMQASRGNGARINGRTASVQGNTATDGAEIEQLVGSLSSAATREGYSMPILDQTGLSGKFDFDLNYKVVAQDHRPDVFIALQEQLGLKLEPRREKLPVMVIDRIELPEPN
jgi:uncharacterized protein (TIGR03435 family)